MRQTTTTIVFSLLLVWCCTISQAAVPTVTRGYTIPTIDLAADTSRQVVVDREPGQYLGHPTTVLFEDNKTMICVYPKGHGRGPIVMRRSTDAGLTWSPRLKVPDNWASSKEVPTIHRTVGPDGKKRLIMFSGLYPIRMAVSADDTTWSPLKPIGDFGGIVAMGDVVRLKDGKYMALFHDDGRFIRKDSKRKSPPVFYVYKTLSADGGLTWSQPEVVASHASAHLCEPGVVRSPDGKQLAMLLRENSRQFNAFVTFSNDEGTTWTKPRELPGSLTGDRHTCRYAPDGRLLISFRDTTHESPTKGDWVAWIGTYEDIVEGREGQYRVRLMDNHRSSDCAYPAIELLPDGTFVVTTYGHWTPKESPYIVSVRFTLDEIDALAKKQAAAKPARFATDVFVAGREGYHTFRIPALLVTAKGTLLAFCEGRKTGRGDHGDLDLILKRSTDGGKTWGPIELIHEEGGSEKITIGNPCPVVDGSNGRIWLPFNRNNDDVLMTYSDDDGRTWSKPRDITADVKPKEWDWYAMGPGNGIQLTRGAHKGRLVIPCDHRVRGKAGGKWSHAGRSHIIYSDDHGKTWQLGGITGWAMNECAVIQREDGSLLLNMRNYRGKGRRGVSFSKDGGMTWTEPVEDPTLVESVCQASLIRYSTTDQGRSRVLFSNPASTNSRTKMTVRLSYDEGKTWAVSKLIDAGDAAYSSLAVLPNKHVGMLYEQGGYKTLTFTSFSLDWLLDGSDQK